VTRDGPDPSGDDRSLLRLAFGPGGALPADAAALCGRIVDALRAAGLRGRAPPLLSRQHGGLWALLEVEGAVADGDPRLSALRASTAANRAQPIGFYATPIRAAPDGGE
jgi:hypothetical protein